MTKPNHPPKDDLGIIEFELVKLTRYLETFGRRTSIYDRIDRASYIALRTLDDLGPSTARDLADALHLDASTVTRQLARLQATGLIARYPRPIDGRSATLVLTTEGRAAMRRVEKARRKEIHAIINNWDAGEESELARALARLNETLYTAIAPDSAALETKAV